ncbi:MAG: HEAT repeat domain-containing protein [Polyangia bacterium]
MGLIDFLSSEKRHARRVDRLIRRANNKHTPKDYRQIALNDLIEQARKGDEVALRGMIQRFSVNAEPSIEDEREKEWVCDALIDFGDKSLPHVKRAMRSAESVNWLQRALRNIVSEDEYREELLDILSEFDTEYERNPDRKQQIIMALAEIPRRDVAEALVRFLEDVDETVRFQTVAALTRQGDEVAREPLLETMCEDESIRVRNEAVAAFADLGWSTSGYKKKVDAILPAGFKQDKSGKIVKLGKD